MFSFSKVLSVLFALTSVTVAAAEGSNGDLQVVQHRELAADKYEICIKAGSKTSADIRLKGIIIDDGGNDYKYICEISGGIKSGQTKCCTGDREDDYWINLDPFDKEKGKAVAIKLKNNKNDGVKITKITFAGKTWTQFSSSTSHCGLYDGCIKWPGCSGCGKNDCVRINENKFMIDGNGGPDCVESITFADKATCCFNRK